MFISFKLFASFYKFSAVVRTQELPNREEYRKKKFLLIAGFILYMLVDFGVAITVQVLISTKSYELGQKIIHL